MAILAVPFLTRVLMEPARMAMRARGNSPLSARTTSRQPWLTAASISTRSGRSSPITAAAVAASAARSSTRSRGAVAAGVPVFGHCLGGQLLARALGAPVARNPVREIGWGKVAITQPQLAREWLGATQPEIEMFQWHSDTFALPARASGFLASRWCANQAFVLEHAGVAHVGMQFHCEVTPAIVRQWTSDDTWYDEVQAEREATGGPAVHDAESMSDDLEARCAAMHVLAARIYARWWRGAAQRAGTDHAAHAIR